MKIPDRNEVGLQKTKKGKLAYPFVEQDGKWVPAPPPAGDGWAEKTVADPPTLPSAGDRAKAHKQLADKVKKKAGYQYNSRGVTVRLLSPVVFNETLGVLEVHVLALKEGTDKLLDVGDGIYQFLDPPVTTEAEFLEYMAAVIAAKNEVG